MSQTDETAGERSTVHSTFALERTYEAAPARVWQTWADPAEKRRWFGPQGPAKAEHELEFRVGGLERMTVQSPGGAYKFIARFQDIVEGERFVHTYEMYLDDARISVSVATVVLEAVGDGTKLTIDRAGRIPRRTRQPRRARARHGRAAEHARRLSPEHGRRVVNERRATYGRRA